MYTFNFLRPPYWTGTCGGPCFGLATLTTTRQAKCKLSIIRSPWFEPRLWYHNSFLLLQHKLLFLFTDIVNCVNKEDRIMVSPWSYAVPKFFSLKLLASYTLAVIALVDTIFAIIALDLLFRTSK